MPGSRRRQPWHPPRQAKKRKGVRRGMLVICPWCERSGVAVTRQGLKEHPASDLDTPGHEVCEGSGQRIAIGAFGRIVKESENEQTQPGSLPAQATAGEPATGTPTGGPERDDTEGPQAVAPSASTQGHDEATPEAGAPVTGLR